MLAELMLTAMKITALHELSSYLPCHDCGGHSATGDNGGGRT
jgi:hypothetical protein